jgi:hypothetical protein
VDRIVKVREYAAVETKLLLADISGLGQGRRDTE